MGKARKGSGRRFADAQGGWDETRRGKETVIWVRLALDEQMSVGGWATRKEGRERKRRQFRDVLSDLVPHQRSDRLTVTNTWYLMIFITNSSSSDLSFPC